MTLLFFGIQATYAEVGDIFVSRTAENIPMKFCVTDEENKECTVYGESIGVLQSSLSIKVGLDFFIFNLSLLTCFFACLYVRKLTFL